MVVLMLVAVRVEAQDAELAQHVDESLALCAAADRLPIEQRRLTLARGLALAETAVALDARSAAAHMAVVCNLGKTAGLGGLGFGAFRAVHRLRHEIDTTLLLAPDHPDALAAKGVLLLRLPRLLGGDAEEAELWLRRALAADPSNTTARAYLDEIESSRGIIDPAHDVSVMRRQVEARSSD